MSIGSDVKEWYCESVICVEKTGGPNTFQCSTAGFKLVFYNCPDCFIYYHGNKNVDIKSIYAASCWEKYPQVFKHTEEQTQKARGLKELKNTKDGKYIQKFGFYIPDYIVITEAKQIDLVYVTKFIHFHSDIFARPCPETPRHGFLDSRKVKGSNDEERTADIKQLFADMRVIDSKSELVLMNRIEAKYSAVITNTIAGIGLGHDGATSGNSAINLPVSGDIRKHKDSQSITEFPYLEAVYSADSMNYCVQLRNGPELPRTADVIPNDMVVSEIVNINDFTPQKASDLLAWEQFCIENREKQGLAINYVGGAVSGHFAIHAKINKIPFVTSRTIAIGEKLEQTKQTPIDYRQVKRGIEKGLSREFSARCKPLFEKHGSDSHSAAYQGLGVSALYALHCYTVAGRPESELIGLGIANLIRLSVCAALGEARHHKGVSALQGHISRDSVYLKYFINIFAGIKKLQITEQIFSDGSWSDSYGGKNWASCTRATITLVNKAIVFVKRPTEANFELLMSQFNKLINEIHNGGKFLNKFISNTHFDHAAENLALYVASSAPSLYKYITLVSGLDNQDNSLAGMKQLRKLSKKDQTELKTILDKVPADDGRCHCTDCEEQNRRARG